MEAIIIIGGLIVLALLIYLWYKVSNTFYEIACEKGYDEKKYLWWTFFLGIIGMLMVVALPDHQKETVPEASITPTFTMKEVKDAKKTIDPERTAKVVNDQGYLVCPTCGNTNPPHRTFCGKCGARLQG